MRKNECLRVTAVALAAAALLSGCNANNIESTSSVPARDTAGTTEESVTETTGTFNHGYSISEASTDRPYEIKRSDDVLINARRAQGFKSQAKAAQARKQIYKLAIG